MSGGISNSNSKPRYAPTVRLSAGARARPDPPGPRNVGRCVSRYRPTHFTFSLIFLHSFSVSLSLRLFYFLVRVLQLGNNALSVSPFFTLRETMFPSRFCRESGELPSVKWLCFSLVERICRQMNFVFVDKIALHLQTLFV